MQTFKCLSKNIYLNNRTINGRNIMATLSLKTSADKADIGGTITILKGL